MTSSFGTFLDPLKVMLHGKFDTNEDRLLDQQRRLRQNQSIEKLPEDDFHSFVNVQFKGVVFLMQKALRLMVEAEQRVPLRPPMVLARERSRSFLDRWRKNTVGAASGPNTVAPGGIVTDFNKAAIRSNPQAQQWIVVQTPMGRLLKRTTSVVWLPFFAAMTAGGSDNGRWLTGSAS
jgi:NAD(P)-dependent dehydrogenase (short-subunit alcohol dehydrogenase family)